MGCPMIPRPTKPIFMIPPRSDRSSYGGGKVLQFRRSSQARKPRRVRDFHPNRVMNAAMSEKDEILEPLRAGLPDLLQRWPIRSLALFGSMARGEASAAS